MISYYKDRFIENGTRVVPIEDRAFNFGDGVYEVTRFYKNQPFGLEEHLERLQNSADAIGLKLPYSMEKIREIVLESVKRSGAGNVDVYFQISRGEATRSHPYPEGESCLALFAKPAIHREEEMRKKGISAITTEDDRWLNCYIKSLNLLPNVIAKQKAMDAGTQEALFYREDGTVSEGSSTNVFAVKEGVVYTHPANRRILNGITRQFVIKLAEECRIPLKEVAFTRDAIKGMDEMWITSTTMEIMPLAEVDGYRFPSNGMGEVASTLWNAFRSKIS